MNVMSPAQAQQLRQAARVLRDLHEDGFIDYHFGEDDLPSLADQIDSFVSVYSNVEKAEP